MKTSDWPCAFAPVEKINAREKAVTAPPMAKQILEEHFLLWKKYMMRLNFPAHLCRGRTYI
ncbi:MAG TPA: hypothetical protein QGG18_10025 [Rhodospirillales bacterium]|nr:hypothetical protein [Rhodospirillales bacterium]